MPKKIPITTERMVEAYIKWGTLKTAANKLGIHPNTIKDRIKRYEALHNKTIIQHCIHHISDRDLEIVEFYRTVPSTTLTELGIIYGISRQRVEQIILRYEKLNNLLKQRNTYKRPNAALRIEYRCPSCGKSFTKLPSSKKKYCSTKCSGTAKRTKDVPLEQMWEEYKAGATYTDLMLKYGYWATDICRWFRELGYQSRPKGSKTRKLKKEQQAALDLIN